MKSYDYDAVTYDGEVYCINCLPDGVDVDSEEVTPIFADSEWDYYPHCDECAAVHDYVALTTDGVIYEAANAGCEVFYHDEDNAEEGSCWIDEDGEKLPGGWYWWSCEPGCMPDGKPTGPFKSEGEAAFDALN